MGKAATKAGELHQEAVRELTAGRLAQGLRLLEQAAAAEPASGAILTDLGTACWQAGQPARAEAAYRKAVQASPDNPFALNSYGAFLLEQGRLPEAEGLLARAYALKPDHYEIPNNLALLHYRRREFAPAEKLFREAARLQPAWPNVHANIGNVFAETHRPQLAEKAFRHALSLEPRNAAAWKGLGMLCATLRRDDEALDCLKRSLSLHPADEEAWVRLVGLLEWKNQLDEALDAIGKAKTFFPRCPGIVVFEAKILDRRGETAKALALMEDCRGGMKDAGQLAHPFFAGFFSEFGRLHDRAGDADKAFSFFTKSHDCRKADPRTKEIDKTLAAREIAQLRGGFTPETAKNCAPATPAPAPVFLIGFPRSGTTLLDQIISSQGGVQVAEERPVIDRLARRIAEIAGRDPRGLCYSPAMLPIPEGEFGALQRQFFADHEGYAKIEPGKLFLDKFPLNILHAGLIKRVFPAAKFILALRHPCDAVLSCYMQRFELNTAMARFLDLADGARFYDEVFGLWDHYTKVLDLDVHAIRYEDVVSDFKPTVKSLLDFLGLEWNDAVLEFDKTARGKARINTPSYHQVTQKLYTRAAGRWQRYRKHMEPVLDILRPHAEKFGYSMDEIPPA